MSTDSEYMHRCLQLAQKGAGFVQPNPLVGAVIVHNGKIIGEGYHRRFGEAHAEVNAVNAVKNTSLLRESTLYVSLEPCSHHGKTPPCAELLVSKKIPRVVVATADPNPKVSGKGIEILRKNGIEVTVGVLEKEAREQNRVFFVNQTLNRPYVTLKWAQSADGFMDNCRTAGDGKYPAQLSNAITQSIVHKFRTQVAAIMVGTNTALLDNPQLTARKWYGQNPVRVVIDRMHKIPQSHTLFRPDAPTIVFCGALPADEKAYHGATFIPIDFSADVPAQILSHLYERNLASVLVEGGAGLLSSFITQNLWDEAFVEISAKKLGSGVKAPDIQGEKISAKKYLDSDQIYIKSKITRNFL